jgi:hypothetical protein
VERIVSLASKYGRSGYRRITVLLRNEGWRVNHKRVERIWRQEGLKVPAKQPKRGRLWLTDGSCIRLHPERKDHVWSYDIALIRTIDGRALRSPSADLKVSAKNGPSCWPTNGVCPLAGRFMISQSQRFPPAMANRPRADSPQRKRDALDVILIIGFQNRPLISLGSLCR